MTAPTTPEMKALEDAVFHRIDEERGPLARLRSLPRAPRYAIFLGLFVLEAAFVLLFARRPDLGEYPVPRMALAVVGYGGILLASAWLALRPLYLPERPRARRALVVLGLLLPLLLALLPEVQVARPSVATAQGAKFIFCFAIGSTVMAAILLLGWLLDRGGSPAMLLAAIAAGVAGALLLHLHCPINAQEHLLLGHATVPVAALGVGLWLERRRARV